jgi:hypothetical protein
MKRAGPEQDLKLDPEPDPLVKGGSEDPDQ